MSADEWLRSAMDDAEAAGHIALLDVLEDPDLTDDERRERITGLLPKPTPNGADYTLWHHFVGALNSIPILTGVERRKHLNTLERIFAISPPPRPKPAFPLVRFRDIKLSDEPFYIVDDIIPREALVVAWGPPKCGKSFLIFDLVMHVALGRYYRGHHVEAGPVVYVAAEGERGIHNRVETFRQRKLAEADADPPFYLLTTRLNLAGQYLQLAFDIETQVTERRLAIIVIDTLNRTLSGSENSDEDMAAYRDAADALRERFRATVIIIHHCGLEGTRPRGHSSLTGAVDTQLAVSRAGDGLISTKIELMKDGPEGETILSRLQTVPLCTDRNGKEISSCILVPDSDGADTATSQRKKLGPAARLALRLFDNAMAVEGKKPPAQPHVPKDVFCITEQLWRDYCYNGGISGGSEGAKRKAFYRAANDLIDGFYVAKWGELLWRTHLY